MEFVRLVGTSEATIFNWMDSGAIHLFLVGENLSILENLLFSLLLGHFMI